VVDIGLITPIYARGGAHLIHVQAAFYAGLTRIPQQVALYRCLERADAQFGRELAGLVVLAVQGGNLPGIVTRTQPVRTLADLRGLRLRAPAELLEVLRRFGADPVEMPMGEVYSALAKGVLDGVVAPADTLRSLHFAEVAHYFYALRVPRGAYAARAVGLRHWQALTDTQRALLQEGVAVWERELDGQLRAAEIAGERAGHVAGMEFIAPSPEDTTRFLVVYNDVAEHNARLASRFDIDGLRLFRYARGLVARAAATGEIDCAGDRP
jgi:TRAP-type C4-dicarboxylate transport system substrate-binding protein